MVRWHHGFNDMNLGQLQEMPRTGKPGVMQSKGSQRVGHDLATEQQQRKRLKRYITKY